jgi:hypothetical protein
MPLLSRDLKMNMIKWQSRCVVAAVSLVGALAYGCSSGSADGETNDEGMGGEPGARQWSCVAEEGTTPESLSEIGCRSDFDTLAAAPTNTSLPGAMSGKFLLDRVDDSKIYFQNTNEFKIHYEFASTHLSAVDGLPAVGTQQDFNENYTSSQRRFVLGAITYYEAVDAWAMELSPYDTASVEMIADAFERVAGATYFGDELKFHPSGQDQEALALGLPSTVQQISTDEIYSGTDFQPLTLGKSCGKLLFYTAEELETNYVTYRDIVVLDTVPNDISVTQGIITAEFQTPLSHVNVLSQNRGTPNMGLKTAFEHEELRALEGKWVTLEVGANGWTIEETDEADADECLVRPEPIEISGMDLSVTEITDIKDIYDPESEVGMKEQISSAISAFGGKASHYSALAWLEEVNSPEAFAIPVYFYNQFMEENGFDLRVTEMLQDEQFISEPAVRDATLEQLRADMMLGTINADFMSALVAKLESDFPDTRMRYRSSTNAEDLGDFTGAGLYTSKSGELTDPLYSVEDALREVWGSIWFFRAFEERDYRGIAHDKVGMALLAHRSFPEEEANGVASTSNPFDASGTEPAFYVNVQYGGFSVVQPENDATTDQFIYYFDLPNQPIEFIDHSSLIPAGETVLTETQTYELGTALKAIHQYFYEAYGKDNESGWYAMDVEFKFEGEVGEEPILYVKQARPYPGR